MHKLEPICHKGLEHKLANNSIEQFLFFGSSLKSIYQHYVMALCLKNMILVKMHLYFTF